MYRKVILKAMKAAGVKPWPKLFQNCRASRETELARGFHIQTVCTWIGNSPQVAARHYLQTTEDDFRKATGQGAAPAEATAGTGGDAHHNAHQNTHQTTAERSGTDSHQAAASESNPLQNPGLCDSVPDDTASCLCTHVHHGGRYRT